MLSKLLLIILLVIKFLVAQKSGGDKVLFDQQLKDFIDQGRYASAHLLLEERLLQENTNPYYLCLLVKNGLKHYFKQDNYNIFYLMDKYNTKKIPEDSVKTIQTARLRYPQRILRRIITMNKKNAEAFKLLGDYYEIQLRDLSDYAFIEEDKLKELEQNIFSNYSQAEKLGLNDTFVNRWLANYYLNSNHLEKAEKLYLKNISEGNIDATSLFRLAEINYQIKQYTQSYNYAIKSLKVFSKDEIYLRYDAQRLAAQSLKLLGELDKFLYHINECIQILPDLQDAYIDLFNYYEERNELNKAESILKKMLLSNPYDLRGFRVLEQFILKTKNFYFSDSLFDEMLMKYENWDEVLANIYWSKGNLAFHQNLNSEAATFWDISRNYMGNYLPENSPLLKQVGEIAGNK